MQKAKPNHNDLYHFYTGLNSYYQKTKKEKPAHVLARIWRN